MNDAEYEQKVDVLLEQTTNSLREAVGDPDKLRAAISAYLTAGDELEMSPYELRDYFDISSPGLAEAAGYVDDKLDELGEIYTRVSEEYYEST